MAINKKLQRIYELSPLDVREAVLYYLRQHKDQPIDDDAVFAITPDGAATVHASDEAVI